MLAVHVGQMKSAIAIRVAMTVIYLADTAAVSNLAIFDLSRLAWKIVLESKCAKKKVLTRQQRKARPLGEGNYCTNGIGRP